MSTTDAPPVAPEIGEWRITLRMGSSGHSAALDAYAPDGMAIPQSALPELYLDYAKVKASIAAHDLWRAFADYPDTPADAHLLWNLSPRATRGPCPCPDNRHGRQDAGVEPEPRHGGRGGYPRGRPRSKT